MISQRFTLLMAATAVASATSAQAHFLWIAPDSSPNEKRVHIYFSETAGPDDPALLSRLNGLKVEQRSSDGRLHVLESMRDKDSLMAIPEGIEPSRNYSLSYTYGVHSRNGETYLLVYHARMYPADPRNHWNVPPSDQRLPLELVPSTAGGKLTVCVLWQGKPLPAAEVQADPAEGDHIDGNSDAAGLFSVAANQPGLYAFRAKRVENIAGEQNGKKYASIRHYSTLVVTVAGERPTRVTARKLANPSKKRSVASTTSRRSTMVSASTKKDPARRGLPDLPFGITSFGATIVDQNIYVCGGHLGPAHEYDVNGQSDRFLRLNLHSPDRWEIIGSVPRRAGLAMVSYGGKVHRIGGFEARNKKDEPADLHSMRDFSRFDPATGRWEDLAPLPKGRSSHEAVVVGSRIVVIGGWELRGSQPSIWHDTALQIDLSSERPTWTELPKPPFRRRALALGEYQGQVYVLGGMQEHGGPTTTTDVLDLANGKWTVGPKLPGEGLQGFGGCAVTCGGQLYATTYSGKVSCLSEEGREWRDAGHLTRPRFFHRMLYAKDSSLIVLGGGNMEEGKDLTVEVVPIPSR